MALLREYLTSSILAGVLIAQCIIPTFAYDNTDSVDEVMQQDMLETQETSKDQGILMDTIAVSSNTLNEQLDDLYHEIGDRLNIDYLYVKIMHMISGGKAVYADASPNIKIDTTVENIEGAFDIPGIDQDYELIADWIMCPDENVIRPSKYYLPDAAYNVMADVIAIMNSRYYADRGNMQSYFDALNNDVKTTIIFCEAVLKYTGSTDEAVNSFYSVYEKMLYDKDKNENVLEVDENGVYKFKSDYKNILISNNISTDRELEILSIILRFDANLAASASTTELSESLVMPYDIGYQSRENMMIAAMSVVGKVRYVWGGGHIGASSIKGINPNWEIFNSLYGTSEGEDGYLECIRPSGSWCPIHGENSSNNGCSFSSSTVYSADQFVEERSQVYSAPILESDSYKDIIESINFSNGISSHRLDGLDCSGYVCWVYNQVQNSINYNSDAYGFNSQSGIEKVRFGSKLLPGDTFGWSTHILMIVGQIKNDSKAYVIVESSPNMVKFGVGYYSGASNNDIELAKQVANEANLLLGNIDDTEGISCYNFNSISSGTFGRLSKTFIDEYTVLSDYSKKINDMNAIEIIQHTINNMPYQYLTGINNYTGSIFNTLNTSANNINITVSDIKEEAIILTDALT